ncbi:hypothetical protein CC80DRAFT_426705 [Byssothecium circinans]|uniref:Nephrocystin 3-like N-terminal domain-containing protein n=1 Tax=Byssothecium circinans TaxID=147558 RepID=A0A6A5TEH8_9PLEO|nr:hypothetical protein CC80DRAFT_426705 [Byssothecium circinans]
MDPLSITASIIAILQLTSKVMKYLNHVKDAPKDRAQCAIEASNLYNLLTTLRYRLEEGASNELWYTAVRALGVKNGPLDQYKLALEQLHAKIATGGGIKGLRHYLLWKFIKEEVMEIMARIGRLRTLVQLALEMDHLLTHSNTEAIKNDTGFIRLHIPAMESGLDRVQQRQDQAKRDKIMEWISRTDFPAQQSDILGHRQEGTGQWFLNDATFHKWLHGPKETLFCPGIPGAGKTMMATITVNHLLESMLSDTVGVAYVYCNYKTDQDTVSLLAAILKQLVQGRPSIMEPVARLHKQHAERGTTPSLNEIFGALQCVVANYSSVYVVVDALDECPDQDGTRHQFLAKLRDLQGERDVRLMATSRFISDIVSEFSAALTLEVRASDDDVKRFVAGQTYRLPKCIQCDDAL